MKIVMAQLKHETNTFSPVPTPYERFSRAGGLPRSGAAAIEMFRGTGSALGAFIEIGERLGATLVVPIAANAPPSGPTDRATYERLAATITTAVADGCDLIWLDLHGAMVTDHLDDGEGELLARVRRLAPGVPIGVALDMHANVSPTMLANADVIAGYQTFPHVDMAETGRRAARATLAIRDHGRRPTVAWGRLPMLTHVTWQGTEAGPNATLQRRCREIEAEGALAASVFMGFAQADVADAGLSVIVATDDDDAAARRWRDELLDLAWQAREAFVYHGEPLTSAIDRARTLHAAQGGPVVLLDHADNCASGGTMDTTTVLAAVLESGLDKVAMIGICDPAAVATLAAAGVGATIELALGGRTAMPALGLEPTPLVVRGTVAHLCDGRFRNEGPMSGGEINDMGPSAVLDTGRVRIAIVSRQQEPYDIACLRVLDIDPTGLDFLVLKSRMHWRAGLGRYARAVVQCDGTGVCTSDYAMLAHRRIARPMYPIDPATPRPEATPRPAVEPGSTTPVQWTGAAEPSGSSSPGDR